MVVPGVVPVSDGGLVSVFVSRDVLVQVGEAAGRRLGDVAQLVPRHDVGLQVVCERALRSHKHQLSMSIKRAVKTSSFFSVEDARHSFSPQVFQNMTGFKV